MEDKKQWGGRRQGSGRKPLNPDEPTLEATVTLPKSVYDHLSELGQGVISKGVRQLVEGKELPTTERKTLVSPNEIKNRLHSWVYVAQAVIKGLEGEPFSWTAGEWDSYKHKAKVMGLTLVTKTWLEKNGCRLRRGASPVGTAYFKAPISNTGKLYVLECQAVKEDSDSS